MTTIKTTKASNLIWGLSLTILTALLSCGDDDDGPTITLDPRIKSSTESVSFSEIQAGETTSQSFTLTGRDLTDDVGISLSGEGFSISLSESDGFGTSVTIAADDINAGDVTVYLRFSSSTEGETTGSATVASELGSIAVSLSGTVAEIVIPKVLQWVEDFDYTESIMPSQAERHPDIETALVNSTDWVNVREAGDDMALTDGLTFTDYISSGVGKALDLNTGGTTVNYVRSLADMATDSLETLYVSFLINVTTAKGGNGSQPLVLGTWNNRDTAPGSDFQQRFIVKDDGSGNLQFGIVSNAGLGNGVFSDKTITADQTYLIVLKYIAKGSDAGGTNPEGVDQLSLYILDEFSATEPSEADVVYDASNKRDIENVIIQAKDADTDAVIDGIRIANTWTDLF